MPEPPPLLFSVPYDAAVDVLDAFIQYQDTCRTLRTEYPTSLVRLSAQLSRAVRRGQEASLSAPSEQTVDDCFVSALVTYREAAGLLAWSESTVRRRVGEGLLQPVRAGRTVRLRRSDIEKLIEKEPT